MASHDEYLQVAKLLGEPTDSELSESPNDSGLFGCFKAFQALKQEYARRDAEAIPQLLKKAVDSLPGDSNKLHQKIHDSLPDSRRWNTAFDRKLQEIVNSGQEDPLQHLVDTLAGCMISACLALQGESRFEVERVFKEFQESVDQLLKP